MRKTTLVYIEKDDKVLMLYRNKKEVDINKGKWIGVGGHVEDGETIEECLLREVKEETGLTLLDYKKYGKLIFYIDNIIEDLKLLDNVFSNNCSMTVYKKFDNLDDFCNFMKFNQVKIDFLVVNIS